MRHIVTVGQDELNCLVLAVVALVELDIAQEKAAIAELNREYRRAYDR